MTNQTVEYLEKLWDNYKNDDELNEIGKLNLVCVMGERVGLLLNEIKEIKKIARELLKTLEDHHSSVDHWPDEECGLCGAVELLKEKIGE